MMSLGSVLGRGLALVFAAILPSAALAICDVEYKVQPGDTLQSVALQHYGSSDLWTLIYYGNRDGLGPNASITPGSSIYLPCPASDQTPDATPLLQASAEMTLLTGSDYAPFTDANWAGGGMVTELINAAMEMTPNPVPYAITWENDWSQHLFPMLDGKQFDMGFPWLKPDCAADPSNERCANFHFSDPLMEMPILLFRRADRDIKFATDNDILGLTLCRPKGYFTHDLDGAGRNWVSGGKVTLLQPDSPEDCMRLVMAGDADLATVNMFLGATKIVEMGLKGQILPLDRPVSEQGLHVVISKKHWRGTTHLYRINAGLQALRGSGRYDQIVQRHLNLFMGQLN